MYNHYAALIPIESVTDSSGLSILNDLVNIEKVPWWKKTEEANGYDFSGKQPKPKKQKKEMNREDRKKYNTALTYHYLREQDNRFNILIEYIFDWAILSYRKQKWNPIGSL